MVVESVGFQYSVIAHIPYAIQSSRLRYTCNPNDNGNYHHLHSRLFSASLYRLELAHYPFQYLAGYRLVLAKILGAAVCRDHPDMVSGDGRRMDLGTYFGRLAAHYLGSFILHRFAKAVTHFATFA